MSAFGAAGGAQTITLIGASAPVITLIDMPSASTEYFLLLPSNCKQFLIRSKSKTEFQIGYITSGPYLDVPRCCFYAESNLSTDTLTLYFTSSLAGETAEIITWV